MQQGDVEFEKTIQAFPFPARWCLFLAQRKGAETQGGGSGGGGGGGGEGGGKEEEEREEGAGRYGRCEVGRIEELCGMEMGGVVWRDIQP